MIIERKGRIVEGFHVLGLHEVPSYLIDAPRPVLVDAGFACLGFLYEQDAREVLGDREPAFLMLTHTHFDHTGSVSRLERAFPSMTICASEPSAALVARDDVRVKIGALNEAARAMIEAMGAEDLDGAAFEPFEVQRVVSDGEQIDLGEGTTLRVISTPGHTRDFTSYYVPERRILVAGEAVGCADVTGYIFTEFLVGYDVYVASIEKLASLPVEVLVQGHHYVYTGEDARAFFGRTLRAAADYKIWVERLLDEENGDIDRVVQRVREVEYDPKPAAKQPEPAYLLNLYARVNHLAARKR